GLLISQRALNVGGSRPVTVERRDRRDVVALTRGLRSRGDRLLGRRRPQGYPRFWRLGERVAEPGHRDAPVAHAAARFELRDAGEGVAGGLERERVQHGDRTVELLLNRRTTGSRKVHFPD